MPTGGVRLTGGTRAATLQGMDDDDRRLLDRLQNELPLTERPWASLAAEIEMPEDEMLERITKLRGEGVVRQISGIFDTRRLGYRSCLVAARSSEGKQQFAADVFSGHPGVTHNYERAHAILSEHQDVLLKMADALLAREVLDAEQVRRLAAGLELDELVPATPVAAASDEDRPRVKERTPIVPAMNKPITQE